MKGLTKSSSGPNSRSRLAYPHATPTGVSEVEIPLVIGVLADLSGRPLEPLPPVANRTFRDVCPDTFNGLLKSCRPRLVFDVRYGEHEKMSVNIEFESLEDFRPDRVLRRLQIDDSLAEKVNDILHHPEYQRMEATWRGLDFLLKRLPECPHVKLRVLNISKRELAMILEMFQAESGEAAWDQNPLFKKLAREPFSEPSGEPFGCFIGDYYFDHSPEDVGVLRGMAQICSMAYAPFVSAAAPEVLGFHSWRKGCTPIDTLPGTRLGVQTIHAIWP